MLRSKSFTSSLVKRKLVLTTTAIVPKDQQAPKEKLQGVVK
jgi:hypothetical protein